MAQFLDSGLSTGEERASLDVLRATWATLRTVMATQAVPGAARCPHRGSGGTLDVTPCKACFEALFPCSSER